MKNLQLNQIRMANKDKKKLKSAGSESNSGVKVKIPVSKTNNKIKKKAGKRTSNEFQLWIPSKKTNHHVDADSVDRSNPRNEIKHAPSSLNNSPLTKNNSNQIATASSKRRNSNRKNSLHLSVKQSASPSKSHQSPKGKCNKNKPATSNINRPAVTEILQKPEKIINRSLKSKIKNMKKKHEEEMAVKNEEKLESIRLKYTEIGDLKLEMEKLKIQHEKEIADLKANLELQRKKNRKLERKLANQGEETKRRNVTLAQLQSKHQVVNEFQDLFTKTLADLLPEEIDVDDQ